MTSLLHFIKDYWIQIIFLIGVLLGFYKMALALIEGVKCSLRNDILQIYDSCKDKREIHKYELEAIELSSQLYYKLKGNSFVQDIVKEVKSFKII